MELDPQVEHTHIMLSAITELMQGTAATKTSQTTTERIQQMPIAKIEKNIFHKVGKAIAHFNMIEQGDRILVAISGGKDSWVMLHILNELKKRAPVDFELVAVNIDQGYAGFRQDIVEKFVEQHGYNFQMETFDIASIIDEKNDGATPCSLCSRLRRGALYGYAEKYKCNKIALGHHQDDLIETLLLNQFFIGKLAAMAPKLFAEDGKSIVIRPLAYVAEEEIKRYTAHKKFPVVCCQCPLMCGETVHGDYKRRMVKQLINILESRIPHVRESLLASITNVNTSHLLDRSKYDFSRPSEFTANISGCV